MKYSHFLCTLERANQEKLKLAITQLKCVPCLNKFTTNYSLSNSSNQLQSSSISNSVTPILMQQNNSKMSIVSHTNMNRLLKQMSLIVSTELQQIAIDLIEKQEDDKIVKYIRLKDEFKQVQINSSSSIHVSQSTPALCNSTQFKPSTSSTSTTTPGIHKTQSFISRNLNNDLSSAITLPSSPQPTTTTTTTTTTPATPKLNETTKQQVKPQIFNPYLCLSAVTNLANKFQDMTTLNSSTNMFLNSNRI